ncbi:major facilitator superfamily domain-containing protein [Mycena vitilis]|nr:major facilitator superfamily domain-containing protein [Mycena vitilis]
MDTTASTEKGEDTGSTFKVANASATSLDKAIQYLDGHADSQSDSTPVDHALLVRKIDRHIVPIALAAYTLQFLDKLDLNVVAFNLADFVVDQYAAVMGLNADLKLMYIANLIAEFPTGYIVQKVRPKKWLGFNIILWGVVTACTAAVTDFRGLVATRVMIGILEAATAPCLMLITGMWYTKSEAILRFAIWYCGLGLAQMLGALYRFQQVTHEALSGWRIMFLVLGCVTAAAGVWTLISMPDSPMEVPWLTEAEKRAAIQRVAVNQTGIKNTHFKWRHLRELVLDPQIWLLTSLILVTSLSSGVISFYSTTLIRNFGFSPARSSLLNMPSGAVTTLYDNRALSMTVFCLLTAMGSALMSFLPSSNRAGLLAGVYLVNMITVTLFLVFCLTTANVAGQTKRVAANALISAAFSVGNIIGPQLFKPKDAPQIYYGWQNSVRDAAEKKAHESGDLKVQVANIEWLNLTDRENKTFRYKY